jgi:hypothetical protein
VDCLKGFAPELNILFLIGHFCLLDQQREEGQKVLEEKKDINIIYDYYDASRVHQPQSSLKHHLL